MIKTTDAGHPYRTTCLVDAGGSVAVSEAIHDAVSYARCPRCMVELPKSPPGSRATRCRCIPLCIDCSVEELNPETYLDPGDWPIPVAERTRRAETRNAARDILRGMTSDEPADENVGTPAADPAAGAPRYGKGDAALDALAMIEAVKTNDARTVGALWDTLEPRNRRTVAAILASWVFTMNGLTAISFDDWARQVRAASQRIIEQETDARRAEEHDNDNANGQDNDHEE